MESLGKHAAPRSNVEERPDFHVLKAQLYDRLNLQTAYSIG
jgi:hypothetical protein